MSDILIRGVPDQVVVALERDAEQNQRSRETHALYLIESALAQGPAETCGELLDAYDAAPVPQVDVARIDSYLATRGRRSNRP